MSRFNNSAAAKDYLIGSIVKEAGLEGVSLSELERKMLYFSEVMGTPPDWKELSAAFDRQYDMPAYEQKIASLIRGAYKHARAEPKSEVEAWQDAIRTVEKEDHYILVMIRMADLGGSPILRTLVGAIICLTMVMLIAMAKYYLVR